MFYHSFIVLLCAVGLMACNSTTPQKTTTNSDAGFSSSTTRSSSATAVGLLIQFHNNVSDQQARQIIAKQQSEVIRVLPSRGLYHIQTPSGMTAVDAIRAMQSLSEVRFVEPNGEYQRRF